MKYPFLVFVLSLLSMWLAARVGVRFRKKQSNLEEGARQDFDVIVAATLTLLALIIGFTFSMAINRFDQRKICEEAEANAIGTEYVRADLLPAANGAKVRTLLRDYLDQRISFYQTRDAMELRQVENRIAQLQAELWSTVQAPAVALPTPVIGLSVSGMNDVLNSKGYTQAAWLNRIPIAAWALLAAIAICANVLVGYSARRAKAGGIYFLVLPLILSIAFFLIADNDSPRRGIIRVNPQNLIALAHSLQNH